jgi:hypothetical protein
MTFVAFAQPINVVRACAVLLQAAGVDVSEGALQLCGLPTMVANTHALDVIQVRLCFVQARAISRGHNNNTARSASK